MLWSQMIIVLNFHVSTSSTKSKLICNHRVTILVANTYAEGMTVSDALQARPWLFQPRKGVCVLGISVANIAANTHSQIR